MFYTIIERLSLIMYLKGGEFTGNEKYTIEKGRAVLGIELGSTRIKAVLIDEKHNSIASGSFGWENKLINNVWTYSIDDIWHGVQMCYKDLLDNVKETYGIAIKSLAAIGFSGMMHGYMVFDKNENLLVPFRTWRNTITGEASQKLTELFNFNIPQRWSIAHLYQSILNEEEHVKDISYMTTLAGYIHWKLTGCKVLGIGEASGMFPIDNDTHQFNAEMIAKFDELISDKNYKYHLKNILPEIKMAGEEAGCLTSAGAKLLDISGNLQEGIKMCPPEGDAGTGMTATNSVLKRTGNISAGTSVFAMVVMENQLSKVHKEIDMVTTPSGDPVAMVHCNNCTSDLNAWVNIFKEFAYSMGTLIGMDDLYGLLYNKALEGDKDCGGLMAYNYYSGEHITECDEGRPLFVRTPESKFNLSNFMMTHLYSALSTLKIGVDILTKEEGVRIDRIFGHGGLFKTEGVGQKIVAAALDVPVAVMKTAGEGGAWGIALLAAFMIDKKNGKTLSDFLENKVFLGSKGVEVTPDIDDIKGFDEFLNNYKAELAVEKAAIKYLS